MTHFEPTITVTVNERSSFVEERGKEIELRVREIRGLEPVSDPSLGCFVIFNHAGPGNTFFAKETMLEVASKIVDACLVWAKPIREQYMPEKTLNR